MLPFVIRNLAAKILVWYVPQPERSDSISSLLLVKQRALFQHAQPPETITNYTHQFAISGQVGKPKEPKTVTFEQHHHVAMNAIPYKFKFRVVVYRLLLRVVMWFCNDVGCSSGRQLMDDQPEVGSGPYVVWSPFSEADDGRAAGSPTSSFNISGRLILVEAHVRLRHMAMAECLLRPSWVAYRA